MDYIGHALATPGARGHSMLAPYYIGKDPLGGRVLSANLTKTYG
jgi:hypothetical protein